MCYSMQHLTVIRVKLHNRSCTLIRDSSLSLSSLSCDLTSGFVLLSRIFLLHGLNLYTDSRGFNFGEVMKCSGILFREQFFKHM